MEAIYRVAFATGSRADYGIVRHYLELLREDKRVDFEIIATGALLSNEYGHQVELIYRDHFKVSAEIELTLNSSKNEFIIHSMAEALEQFGKLFEYSKYDLLILLGDRYEILSIAIAAAIQRIPILHIHGGEATYGNYDEFIRHSITKMSVAHIVVTEEYRRRVVQLGENPQNVYNLGSLGAENCTDIDMANVTDEIIRMKADSYYVVLFHPETLTGVSARNQTSEILKAVSAITDAYPVFIGSNADTHSNVIREMVKNYCLNSSDAKYYENLHTDEYHYLVSNAICLLGNSSSGIIEAPSLGVYTINIGERQAGRVRGNSVVDVKCEKDEIMSAFSKIVCKKNDEIRIVNPYYQPDSRNKYYAITMDILEKIRKGEMVLKKRFYDINY